MVVSEYYIRATQGFNQHIVNELFKIKLFIRKKRDLFIYRRLAFVLIFPKNCACALSGRQNENKLKVKHAESSEQIVNRIPTSIYTNFVSVDFEKNMPDSCTAFGCTNRR